MKRYAIIGFCLFIFSCKKSTPVDCSTVAYSSTIKPLISSKCATSGCHSGNSSIGNFTNYDNVYAYYKSGRLKSAVVTTKSMPPNNSLSSTERKQIECWINNGAINN
ncbi:MAG: hypothetical protein KDC07_01705 [Chitinophagaceae bacterium]|nr:hypothetical protein [Chitinophagaceae bacterium]MCB9044729.1 hypothetical protein [Chitinophagales bacterium]